jgi:hypothetical protein
MGITKFIWSLIFIAIVFLVLNKTHKIKDVTHVKQADVSFYDSIMYEITENSVVKVVQAKKSLIFNGKQELYDATIIVKPNVNSSEIHTISALNIVKLGTKVYLTNYVNFQSSNSVNIRTQQLAYDTKKNIVTSDTYFKAIINENTLYGNDLYYDGINGIFLSKNSKFKIKVTNE